MWHLKYRVSWYSLCEGITCMSDVLGSRGKVFLTFLTVGQSGRHTWHSSNITVTCWSKTLTTEGSVGHTKISYLDTFTHSCKDPSSGQQQKKGVAVRGIGTVTVFIGFLCHKWRLYSPEGSCILAGYKLGSQTLGNHTTLNAGLYLDNVYCYG